jgi:hypothetical protein
MVEKQAALVQRRHPRTRWAEDSVPAGEPSTPSTTTMRSKLGALARQLSRTCTLSSPSVPPPHESDRSAPTPPRARLTGDGHTRCPTHRLRTCSPRPSSRHVSTPRLRTGSAGPRVGVRVRRVVGIESIGPRGEGGPGARTRTTTGCVPVSRVRWAPAGIFAPDCPSEREGEDRGPPTLSVRRLHTTTGSQRPGLDGQAPAACAACGGKRGAATLPVPASFPPSLPNARGPGERRLTGLTSGGPRARVPDARRTDWVRASTRTRRGAHAARRARKPTHPCGRSASESSGRDGLALPGTGTGPGGWALRLPFG